MMNGQKGMTELKMKRSSITRCSAKVNHSTHYTGGATLQSVQRFVLWQDGAAVSTNAGTFIAEQTILAQCEASQVTAAEPIHGGKVTKRTVANLLQFWV